MQFLFKLYFRFYCRRRLRNDLPAEFEVVSGLFEKFNQFCWSEYGKKGIDAFFLEIDVILAVTSADLCLNKAPMTR